MIPRGWKPLARWGLAGGVAAALLGATTVLVWLLQSSLGLTDASAAYLLAVTAVAVLFGPWAAVLGAVAAFGLPHLFSRRNTVVIDVPYHLG